MTATAVTGPPSPAIRLSVGVTGHRAGNPALAANRERVEAALDEIFTIMHEAAASATAPVRLHSLLADGADQIAARAGLARQWELVAPLPFGQDLNVAINANPATVEDAKALLAGGTAADPATRGRADAIRALGAVARRFELADRDDLLTRLYLEKLSAPLDIAAAQAFSVRSSARVALAGRVMVEQSDILVGVWDGVSRAYVGGTGHTISVALEHGAPVVWIDANAPEGWRILHAPEALAAPEDDNPAGRDVELAQLVRAALHPGDEEDEGALLDARWRPRNNRLTGAYRRVETLFAGEKGRLRSLRRTYVTPDDIASGSGAALLAAAHGMPGADPAFGDEIGAILRRYAWADGISAWLSDAYRGGMTTNFMLSACAVVAGILYQPLGLDRYKWAFAGTEFLLLSSILVITWLGGRWRWHGRWFETRRVAEYLRHSPILLALGVARSPGRWPRGGDVNWPEFHARHALRSTGLPRIALTAQYLRAAMTDLLIPHVTSQRDYHEAKARRLTAVHRNLDAFSTRLFQLAVVSVSTYLLLKGASVLHLVPKAWPEAASPVLAFLGVALPTFGAAIAGIRYFGDFERFAAISEITAAKLDAVHSRIVLLLAAPDDRIDYDRVSELAHVADDIVVSEIENWQAVFGGKHIAVPV